MTPIWRVHGQPGSLSVMHDHRGQTALQDSHAVMKLLLAVVRAAAACSAPERQVNVKQGAVREAILHTSLCAIRQVCGTAGTAQYIVQYPGPDGRETLALSTRP